jgi:hypothetical protein
MKFTKRNDRVSREGTRPGFNDSDVKFLSKQIHTPHIQIFSSEEIIEDPAKETFFCAMCKGVLDYDKHLEAYVCKSCVQYYDTTNIQDTPLKDIEDFKLVPYSAQRHYAPFDADDPNTPFVASVPVDKISDEETDGVEIRSYENGRINLHNVSFADAIIKSNVLSSKKKISVQSRLIV